MLYAIILVTVWILFLAESCRKASAGIAVSLALAVTHFLLGFCVISLAAFAFNRFRYRDVLIAECALSLVWLGIAFFTGTRRFRFELDGKNLWIPLLVCALVLPLTAQKAEFFGMGQDEGVYQTEAIVLAAGHTDIYSDFGEYALLRGDEERDAYVSKLDSMLGFYRYEYTMGREEYEGMTAVYPAEGRTAGVFHGLHIFSALLGLWIKLFGLRNMPGVISVLYFCSIFLFYYSARNRQLSQRAAFLITLLFACSPLILWLSKTTYSESLIVLCVVLYLYYLTIPEKTALDKLGLGITAVYFSCVHIIFLVFFPVFWLLHLLMSLMKNDKLYLWDNLLIALSLIGVSFANSAAAMQYFFDNMAKLYIEPILTIHNLLIWITAGALLSFALAFVLYRIRGRLNLQRIVRILTVGIKITALFCLFYAASRFILSGLETAGVSASVSEKIRSVLISFFTTSLWASIFFTGMLVFPWTFATAMRKSSRAPVDVEQLCLSLLYVWFAFIYCDLFNSKIHYYFYYSRYFSYVLPIIFLFFAESFHGSGKRWAKIASVLALVCMLLLDIPIARQKDDTHVEWDVLEETAAQLTPDSALILEHDVQGRFTIPMKYLAHVSVFPMSEDLVAQEEYLSSLYDNVYILCGDNCGDVLMNDTEADDQLILRLQNDSSVNRLVFRKGFYYNAYASSATISLFKYDADYLSHSIAIGLDSMAVRPPAQIMNGSYVRSGGNEAIVVHGPYLSFRAGSYELNLRIDALTQSGEVGTVMLTADNGQRILEEIALADRFDSDGHANIRIPFDLEEDTHNFEVVILETEGTVLDVYPYYIARRF